MKRLFMLRDEKDRPFIQIPSSGGPLCFETKRDAKERRNEVNAAKLGYHLHVSPGPDHRNYRGKNL